MVGIYARVSTEEQARSGFSLRDQVRECRNKASTNEVTEYIDEGISGEFLDRPALSKLRLDVKQGFLTKVICLDPDRLSRKLMNQLLITDELDQRGVELVFVNGEYAKTPEGTLFYSMRGAIAEFEKAKINERMSRGRREKARQGRVLRDFQIYGYDYDKDTEQLVINEREADVVTHIFLLFTQPSQEIQGINGIATYLTERRIPTKRGANVWHRQVVRQILLNRAYIGEFYQNRWNTEGMLGNKHKAQKDRQPIRLRPSEEWIALPCPAIINKAVFSEAQKLLQASRRRWAGMSITPYLLSGLIRCGECGNTMTGRQTKHWGKQVRHYTDRKHTAGAKQAGCGQRIDCERMDKLIWDCVSAWLAQPSALSTVQMELIDDDSRQREAELLKKEWEKTKLGQKRLLQLFAEATESAGEEVLQTLEELKEKERRLHEHLVNLQGRTQMQKQEEGDRETLIEAIRYYFTTDPKALTFDDKQVMIRRFIREIHVYSDRVEINTF